MRLLVFIQQVFTEYHYVSWGGGLEPRARRTGLGLVWGFASSASAHWPHFVIPHISLEQQFSVLATLRITWGALKASETCSPHPLGFKVWSESGVLRNFRRLQVAPACSQAGEPLASTLVGNGDRCMITVYQLAWQGQFSWRR